MKSFIKQPKKNDPTTSSNDNAKNVQLGSNTLETLTRPPTNNHRFTPTSSPKLQQYSQFTPPAVSSSASTNSPKKLLTPIKNLFSSKPAGPTLNTNDNLQGLTLNGASPKESRSSRFRKHIRSRSNASIPTVNDLMRPPARMSGDSRLKSTVSSPSLQDLQINAPKPLNKQAAVNRPLDFVDVPSTSANVSGLGPPLSLSRGSSKNISIASSAEDTQFHTKEVFFDATSMSYINDRGGFKPGHDSYSSETSNDDDEYEDDADEDDDNSSQFSFVQDMKAGRNTSVKYYKTNVSKPKLEQSLVTNSFDENDLADDAEDIGDYDFENNGLGDDYEDYDDYNEFDGENAAYNDMFSNGGLESQTNSNAYEEDYQEPESVKNDSDLQTPILNPEPTFGSVSKSYSPEVKFNQLTSGYDFPLHTMFNSSHHLSIQGPPKLESNDLLSSPRRASIEEDILENYLDPSISDSIHSPSELQSPTQKDNQFELYDVSSPVINGLTIGHNLGHRLTGQNSNRSLIHRNPINMSCDFDHASGNVRAEAERFVVSFHGSFDDRLNSKIRSKIDEFENWKESRVREENNISSSIETTKLKLSNSNFSSDATPLVAAPQKDNAVYERTDSTMQVQNVPSASHLDAIKSQKRSSVAEMMGLLSSLEHINVDNNNTEATTESNKSHNRKSVAEMMGLLSNLELDQTSGGERESVDETKNKETRNSIAGMMNFLASVGGNEPESERPKVANAKAQSNFESHLEDSNSMHSGLDIHDLNVKRKPSFKRYSWFSSQESLTLKGVDPTDDSMKPPPLDQDVLDEINQIPEDFDYDEHNKAKRSGSGNSSLVKGFERSSSYTRKPKRVLMLNQAKPNKIETLNKTVTFYDKNKTTSPAVPLDLNRVKKSNVSRGSSFRSVNSITSISEVNEDEEDEKDDALQIPVHVKIGRSHE
ncbi:hypothetical protein I9W82_004762 [Candida metapsilosis]|uniref:Uncharacterized protein n=1 Tax=Candida metapsilosis TaxID=273372 RepID=A0A8H7ZAW1_9ASCO|nr:hypothetical protein I9W82_004762 [Candida metapsilosis]